MKWLCRLWHSWERGPVNMWGFSTLVKCRRCGICLPRKPMLSNNKKNKEQRTSRLRAAGITT